MRKTMKKCVAAILALGILATPLTASAAWDRLESDPAPAIGGKSGTASSTVYPYASLQKKILEHKAVNKQVVGWLTVPGTNIDEPIVLSPKDNSVYIYRDWKGQLYKGITYQNYVTTATYLDYRTKFGETWRNGTSRNLVLYGHNWNNLRPPYKIGNHPGYTMFAQLPSYTDVNFAAQNPHIYFSTDENEGIWRVFSVAYCEISEDFFYNNPSPSVNNGEYQKLLDEWQARSLHNFDVDVDTSDRIITLSTCTRMYGNNSEGGPGNLQRYVVVARLLRDGESETDTVNVSANPNFKRPAF